MKVDIFNTDKKYDIFTPIRLGTTTIKAARGQPPRIELFARQYADGWDSWGDEL